MVNYNSKIMVPSCELSIVFGRARGTAYHGRDSLYHDGSNMDDGGNTMLAGRAHD